VIYIYLDQFQQRLANWRRPVENLRAETVPGHATVAE
jgi:hypothetical protein